MCKHQYHLNVHIKANISINNTIANTAAKPCHLTSKTTASSLDAASGQKTTPLLWRKRIPGHEIIIANIVFQKLLLSALWHYSPFIILPPFFLNCKNFTFFSLPTSFTLTEQKSPLTHPQNLLTLSMLGAANLHDR